MFNLLILSYQDLKSGKIQTQYNWFMWGIVASMIMIQRPPIIYIVIIIIVATTITITSKKALGSGDIESLSWIIAGVGFISVPRLFIFLMFFVLLLAVHIGARRALKIPREIKLPAMPILTGAFFITALVVC